MNITTHTSGNIQVKDVRDGQVWRSSIRWGENEEDKDRVYAAKVLGPNYESLINAATG